MVESGVNEWWRMVDGWRSVGEWKKVDGGKVGWLKRVAEEMFVIEGGLRDGCYRCSFNWCYL